jgi:enamine deaminase RidA (YjgF/YER057c/UK114 family)
MMREILGPAGAPFAQGLKVAGQQLIFISGQLAVDGQGNVVAPNDMEAQARHVFASIEQLLKEGGATMKNVVKITAFVTTMDGYAKYGAVRREVFGDHLPASSTVGVSSLVVPGCVIEIEAVAVL